MHYLPRLSLLLVLVSAVLCGCVTGGPTAVVEEGIARGAIITDPEPTPAARLAAVELQHHIALITCATLPIVHPGERVRGTRLLVGESEATRALGLRSEDFAPQEYLIRSRGRSIVLMGRDWEDTEANRREIGRTMTRSLADSRKKIPYGKTVGLDDAEEEPIELPGLYDDQSTCYAAYDFLERFCGVRWYGPTPLGVVTPEQPSLVIPATEIRRTPSLVYRHADGGGWPIIWEQWNHPTNDQRELFYHRMRFGGEKWVGNHSLSSYYDRFLVKNPDRPELFEEARPDFFAVGYENEGFWRQLCLTNPDVIAQVAQDARDYFDGKGIIGNQLACGDYFAVVPSDSNHWCQCDRCQAILEKGKSRAIKWTFGTGEASDYIFGFVNAVAREVAKTHPDKYIAALAYHVYSYPPTFPLEPNVAVAPCVQICYAYQKGVFANDAKFYREWIDRERGKRPMHLWNYFHHPMERALMGEWKCFPAFMPDVISEWVKRYHEDGIRGVFLCGIPQQFGYYLFMRTAFDADTDLQQTLDEFFSLYFGAAAEPMKRFYCRISEINAEEGAIGTSKEASWERLGTEERMKELGALMEEAVARASTDLEKRRVATWKKGVWDYMAKGRAQYVAEQAAKEVK